MLRRRVTACGGSLVEQDTLSLSKRLTLRRANPLLAAAIFLIVFFLSPVSVPAQSGSKEICLSCHGSQGMEKVRKGKAVSLYVDREKFSQSIHSRLECASCHRDASQVPHPPELKPVECSTCHTGAFQVYSQSVHGKAHAKGDGDVAFCSDCHGSHNILPAKHPDSKVYPLNLPRTCGACHGDPELAKRHRIPVANAYQLYMDSIHGRALTKSGLLVAANCVSCHGSHEIKPKMDLGSKVNRATSPSTCGHCHAGILSEYSAGVHGQALGRGSQVAPVCADCHTAHEIQRVDVESWRLDIVRECGTCHRESLRTYRDTFHGQVTSLGFSRVARCSDCHGSHRIVARSDPASSISPANLVSTCQKCHPKANQNFVRFTPHADPNDRERNPGLYYAARFMNILLVGVFLFFGIHTSLWMLRTTIAMGWRRKPPKGGGQNNPSEEK